MPSASPCLLFAVFAALTAPCQAQTLPSSATAPVARLQLTDDLPAVPTRPVPGIRLPEPGGLFPDLLGMGAGFFSSDRVSTQADLHGGNASGPRLDLSVGFNF